jgi:PAP2 superfamily
MKKHLVAGFVLLLVGTGLPQLAAGAPPRPRARSGSSGEAVLMWNDIAAQATVTSGISPLLDPLHESRLYAMVHIAINDALNAIQRRTRPYVFNIGTFPGASPEAAVAAAAHDVLVPVLRDLPDVFAAADIDRAVQEVDDAYNAALGAIADGKAKRQGIAIGKAAAAVIVATRSGDGADTEFLDHDKPRSDAPGQFQFVEKTDFQVAPGWADVTPFVMRSGAQYRPRPPYDLTSKKYAADLNEIKEFGRLEPSSRDAEQTEIAFFWFEASPMRWNRIARTVSEEVGLDLWANARLFGLLNVALADGYIGNWDSKQFYNRWRPETAVRLADTDGNPNTTGEATWTPLWGSSGATPEYDSGHTIEGSAAAVVLADVFGTDAMTFDVCSYTFKDSPQNNCDGSEPIVRHYASFSQASDENGVSRIYIGWHFRNAVDSGHKHGTQIGNRAVNHFFQPVH